MQGSIAIHICIQQIRRLRGAEETENIDRSWAVRWGSSFNFLLVYIYAGLYLVIFQDALLDHPLSFSRVTYYLSFLLTVSIASSFWLIKEEKRDSNDVQRNPWLIFCRKADTEAIISVSLVHVQCCKFIMYKISFSAQNPQKKRSKL
jgi:hypothetical protein